MSAISASAPSSQTVKQPINQAAVIDAALRAINSAYGSSEGPDYLDFARVIRESQEANQELEDLLWLGSEEEDARYAFGVGMVAGMLYAASTGTTSTA
jgi:hypothetical protein